MRTRQPGLYLAVALGLTVSIVRAHASVVLLMELPELTADADRIVVADVTSVSSAWNKDGSRIYSTIEIAVREVWKGKLAAGGRLTIVQPGGVVADIEMRVHGLPTFDSGERALFFLRGGTPSSIVGFGQGKRPLRLDATSKRWMVDGADRSSAVRLDGQGQIQPAPPQPSTPLDDLRRQVRTLVGTSQR